MVEGIGRTHRQRFLMKTPFSANQSMLQSVASNSESTMQLPQWLETLRQDSRISLRLMRRAPAFFSGAILTLALGIGANGAVFSILQSVLLQPLPYEDASRLVIISNASRETGLPLEFSGPMTMSIRDAAARQFGEVAAAQITHGGQLGAVQGDHLASALDLSIGDRAVRLNGASVTPNFFRVLGVRASIGRLFADGDDGVSGAAIVLSDATWQREFGADPTIIGRPLTIGTGIPRVDRTFRVVGVLPRGVHFTYPTEVEAWTVLPWTAVSQSNPYAVGQFTLVSRVRPELAVDAAHRLISSMPRNALVAPSNARGGENDRLDFLTMRDWVVGDTRPSLYLLGGVAVLLLLVTCVTVSNGLLARISERHQELAVRSALGAERWRLLQQLLVEGALLTVGGTIAGTCLAILLQPILRALLPGSVPQIGELRVNASIIEFAAGMTAITTILAAVAPAWGGTRTDAAATLTRAASGGTAGRAAMRSRHLLVGMQAALTTMLLIFSALLLTSLWRLGQVPLGFDPHDVLAINVQLLDARYRVPGAVTALQENLLRGVRGIPGVVTAGLTSAIPFRGFDSPAQVQVVGSDEKARVRMRYVDSAFFAALRVPILRGRLLGTNDRAGSPPVAVVSQSFARRVFGTANPVGKTISLINPTEIVGVVGNMRYGGLDKEASPAVYVPMLQYPRPLATVVVRMTSETTQRTVVDQIRRVLHDVDPALPVVNVAMVDDVVAATIAGRRFYSVATGAFAIVALTLTTIGLALVVARAVAERRRELAIRSALGATLMGLARVAVGDALAAITGGVVAGLLLASIGSVLIAQFLFQITARSPNAYGGSAALVVVVAGLAAWIPMRRFARLPLAELLRQD
jgi:putative ABC transport system permease protein